MQVYVSKDGQQFGPYTLEQLGYYVSQGNFTIADHACYDGQNWISVGQIPGFSRYLLTPSAGLPTDPEPHQNKEEETLTLLEAFRLIGALIIFVYFALIPIFLFLFKDLQFSLGGFLWGWAKLALCGVTWKLFFWLLGVRDSK